VYSGARAGVFKIQFIPDNIGEIEYVQNYEDEWDYDIFEDEHDE
jgi:hypothetical protein